MIDWTALLLVAVVAIGGAAVIVALFATGIRFLSTPPADETSGAIPVGGARDDEMDDVSDPTRPLSATVGGIVCFALAGAGVLFGVYLIIPALHG